MLGVLWAGATNCPTDYSGICGSPGTGTMGVCSRNSAAGDAALPHHFIRSRRTPRSGDCRGLADQFQNRRAVARTFSQGRRREFVGSRCRSRAKARLFRRHGGRRHCAHAPKQTSRGHALELPHDGQGTGIEQGHRQPDLAKSSTQTASHRELQTFLRPALSGQADRRGGFVFESARQGAGALSR